MLLTKNVMENFSPKDPKTDTKRGERSDYLLIEMFRVERFHLSSLNSQRNKQKETNFY